ncbi:MAG: type II secretion system protein [Erysipelothrix sp.]|nr:type II secretion system protein [Erysipelothrix sp.]
MREKRKGMTLVEVIVAMAIFAIIIVMVFPALAVLNKNNTISHKVLEATYYTQKVAESLNKVSTNPNSDEEMLREYLVSNDYTMISADSYEKALEDAPYIMTISFSSMAESSSLLKIKIEAAPKNDSASDYSELEMVVRLSADIF